jgi:hypothetical protein
MQKNRELYMSVLSTRLSELAERIKQHGPTIQTEEAVKTSVVLPFLAGLGYDIFNPAEVVPEFTADAVGKRGEKVDYAICQDGKVSILVECKALSVTLDRKHLAQLYRYFTVTEARFAILTNGQVYQFYSDLSGDNRLDQTPFFVFDLLNHSDAQTEELQKFARSDFDVDRILQQAERLKYVNAIRNVIDQWFDVPSDGLVRAVATEVYEGRLNADVREMLTRATRQALRDTVRDRVRGRLSSALQSPEVEEDTEGESIVDDIETTDEEIEAYHIVRAIGSQLVSPDRVKMRDAKSYCAILLDDNNRRPIVRLHFNGRKKRVGFFDGDGEERADVSGPVEIYQYVDRVKNAIAKHISV